MNDEKKDNPAVEKSFSFASGIVKFYQHLSDRNRLRLLNASKFNIIHSTQKNAENCRRETEHEQQFIFHLLVRHSSKSGGGSSFIIEA